MAEPGQVIAMQMETPKSTVGIFELPCGYLDEAGTLHTEVEVREITGAEEDMLGSERIKDNQKVDELIANCVKRIGTIIDKAKIRQATTDLLVGDRAFLMFAIRRATLGDDFPFKDRCPECKAEKLYTVNLNDLEVYKMPEPKKRVYDVTTSTGKKVRFKMVYGKDEVALGKMRSNDVDSLSLGLLFRIEMLGDKPPQLADIKALGMKERSEIRDAMTAVDGGMDTEVDLGCPNCGYEFTREIDAGQPGFFFPSAVQKRRKRRSSIS